MSLQWKNSSGISSLTDKVNWKDSLGTVCGIARIFYKNASGVVSELWSDILRRFTVAWSKTGFYNTASIAVDPDKNVYVLSQSSPYLVKLSSSGTKIWTNDNVSGYGRGIEVDSYGDIYEHQNYASGGLRKRSATNGEEIWFNDKLTVVNDMKVDCDNNVIVTWGGNSYEYLKKINGSTGSEIWYKYASGYLGNGVVTDSAGNIYVCCGTSSSGKYLKKFNSSGTQQYSVAINNGWAVRMAIDSKEEYIYGVQTNIARKWVASTGELVWERTVTGAYDYGIAVDAEDSLYLGFAVEYDTEGTCLKKYSKNGLLVWEDTSVTASTLKIIVDEQFDVYTGHSVGYGSQRIAVKKRNQY